MKRSRETDFDENYNDEEKIANKFDNKKFENRSHRLVVSKLAHNNEKSNNSRNFQNRKRSQSARNFDEKKIIIFFVTNQIIEKINTLIEKNQL